MSLICESTRGRKRSQGPRERVCVGGGGARSNTLKDKRKENYYQGPEAFFRRPGVRLPSSPSFSRPPVDNMQINAKLSSQSFRASNVGPLLKVAGGSKNLHPAEHPQPHPHQH